MSASGQRDNFFKDFLSVCGSLSCVQDCISLFWDPRQLYRVDQAVRRRVDRLITAVTDLKEFRRSVTAVTNL